MREYESEYNGINFFQKYIDRFSDYSRPNKMSDTIFFMSYLDGKIDDHTFNGEVNSRKCLHDGLLGEIFQKFLSIKNHSNTCYMRY